MAARALSAALRTRCSNARSAAATCTSAPRSSPAAHVAAASRGIERPAGRSHWGRSRARCCCCCCLGPGWAPVQVPPLAVALSTCRLLAGAATGELGRPAGGQVVATNRQDWSVTGWRVFKGGGQVWSACLLSWQADDVEGGQAKQTGPLTEGQAATSRGTTPSAAAAAEHQLACAAVVAATRTSMRGHARRILPGCTGCEGARCAGRLRLQPRRSVGAGLQKAGRAAEGGAGSARRARRCRNTLQDTRSQPEPKALFGQAGECCGRRPSPPETPLLGHCAPYYMRPAGKALQAGPMLAPAIKFKHQTAAPSTFSGARRLLTGAPWLQQGMPPWPHTCAAGREGCWPCTQCYNATSPPLE